jgi:hypothetical protein
MKKELKMKWALAGLADEKKQLRKQLEIWMKFEQNRNKKQSRQANHSRSRESVFLNALEETIKNMKTQDSESKY